MIFYEMKMRSKLERKKTGNSMRTRSIFVDISADLFNEYLGSMKKLEFATDDVYVARFLSS